jgi:hypothetical protein
MAIKVTLNKEMISKMKHDLERTKTLLLLVQQLHFEYASIFPSSDYPHNPS